MKEILIKKGGMGVEISTMEFLSAFFKNDERICLRAFSDNGGKGIPELYGFPLRDFVEWEKKLQKKNGLGCGVFFCVNFGGHYDKYISRINAVFFESDYLSFEEQMALIEKSPLKPSVIVKTRKSLHTYFLVDDFPTKKFRNIQERLARFFSSDGSIKNESRVMRLPNFYHMKAEPIMVEAILFEPGRRYKYEEINAVFPLLPPKEKKQPVFFEEDVIVPKVGTFQVRDYLEVVRERENKFICRCPFSAKHRNKDIIASAVVFKDEYRPWFFCSGCQTSRPLVEVVAMLKKIS